MDAGAPSFITQCGGTHTSLTGTVYAPNGTDPIPNVRVYAAAAINAYPTQYCDRCDAPVDPAFASTYTAPNGTFSLSLDEVPAGASIDFTIQIGRFRKHTTVPVTACTSAALAPASAAVLPGNSTAGDIPSIVVSTGNEDHLDVVLTNLGITQYDCYEGTTFTGTSDSTCQLVPNMTIADVIEGGSLANYDMAFLSCAPGAYADYITTHDQSTMTSNTQNWVTNGGRIFVTDTAYDYIAQPFPSDITWEGTSGSPQPVDDANIGCAPKPDGGSAHAVLYPATVDDMKLGAWLELEGVASGSPPVAEVQGFYEPWSAIASLPMTSETIIDAKMPIDPTFSSTGCSSPTTSDLPLTTQFEVGGCGRVVFSSFHTYTGTGATSQAANEKIMEYLIFAVAQCGG